ncbi:MAG: Ppx/GppA family phosphatase [Rhodospirillales bacterium]|nr:Ppx/GppA family phosphatase [Rhodospirillales bacterium]
MTSNVSPLRSDAPPPGQAADTPNGRIGIVDIGSNTVRLVVFDAPARLPVPIFNERVACRLGRGIGQSGRLDPEGVQLAFETLDRFTAIAREIPVERFKMVATAAVREAADGPEFAKEVTRRFGYPVEILSGEEEARLSAAGILGGMPGAYGLLGDLGGGSLDLVTLDRGRFGKSATYPLGHLRLSEDAGGDTNAAGNLVDTLLHADDFFENQAGRHFFAVGGALRSIGRIFIEQTDYPLHVLDNLTINPSEALDLCEFVIKSSPYALKRVEGISKKRTDTLPFAALTLDRLINITKPDAVVVSGYGLREGLFFESLGTDLKSQDPLIAACEGFARRGGRFAVHGEEINNWIRPIFAGAAQPEARICMAASLLSDVGWTEHPDYRALHAFIRVLRFPVAGISHPDRVMLALAIFIRYGGALKQYEVKKVLPLISTEEKMRAVVLGLALRLAHVFSGGVPGLLPRSTLKLSGGKLTLAMEPDVENFAGSAARSVLKLLAAELKAEVAAP